MFMRANFVDIYLQWMRDRSMRSGTELAGEIKLTDWSMAGNLSNRSSGVKIPRDICTRLNRYLYSAKCSWIIKRDIRLKCHVTASFMLTCRNQFHAKSCCLWLGGRRGAGVPGYGVPGCGKHGVYLENTRYHFFRQNMNFPLNINSAIRSETRYSIKKAN